MANLGWSYLSPADKDAIVRGVQDGVAYGGPYHIEIHPSGRCNIDCFFCSTAALRGNEDFPLGRLQELAAELKASGTRSVRLAGGGEPLFHRGIDAFLECFSAAGIRIENLTTNGVLLTPARAELLAREADSVTFSLNTGDPASFASMMQTTERNFDRVLDNVRALVAARKKLRGKTPVVVLQFLVFKENYRTIPSMYRLAIDLGVDRILFSGLAFLPEERRMTAAETAEMMELYEQVVTEDEYRRIFAITSFEQDLSEALFALDARVARKREAMGPVGRLARLLFTTPGTLGEKLAHRRRMREKERHPRAIEGLSISCLIGWHSLVLTTSGGVAPCCILQGESLGNVYRQSLREVWHGAPYQRFRASLARILREQQGWTWDPGRDGTVVPMCGLKGAAGCRMDTFYFESDMRFLKDLQQAARHAPS